MPNHLPINEVCSILRDVIEACASQSEGECLSLHRLLPSVAALSLRCGQEQYYCPRGSACFPATTVPPALPSDTGLQLSLTVSDRWQADVDAGMAPHLADRKHRGIRAEYSHPPPAIHFAVRELGSRSKVVSSLAHELTHAVDHGVLGMDLGLCGPLACSELRAALAGECASSWHPWLQRDCAWSAALHSTQLVFPKHGRTCVDQVFTRCYGSNLGENPVPELAPQAPPPPPPE